MCYSERVTCDAQVPPRRQLEADSSASSDEGDVRSSKVDGAAASGAAASWLPPLKKEKQKRKVAGGGWFDGAGGGGGSAVAADVEGGQGGACQTENDDFGWGEAQGTFQKRKPRAVGGMGFKMAAVAAPSAPKVSTHFMAGTGVSDLR